MIEARNLQKSFRKGWFGEHPVLHSVSFACKPGQVTGLLGANGAGKTTTLRLLSTALKPTGGSATVAGYDLVSDSRAVRESIGFLTGATALYPRLTPLEMLRFFGQLHGMEPARLEERIQVMTALFRLEDFIHRTCDKLSTGMKQRVSLARCLLHDPPVYILDEPTTGLDIPSAHAIHEVINTAKAAGKTILFSTHHADEIQRLCDHIVVMSDGRICFEGTAAALEAQYQLPFEEAFLAAIQGGNKT